MLLCDIKHKTEKEKKRKKEKEKKRKREKEKKRKREKLKHDLLLGHSPISFNN